MQQQTLNHAERSAPRLTTVLASAFLAACAAAPMRPSSFDATQPSALLYFGPREDEQSRIPRICLVEILTERDERLLGPTGSPDIKTDHAGPVELNAGTYAVRVSYCQWHSNHRPPTFTLKLEAQARRRYRIDIVNILNMLEAEQISVGATDESTGTLLDVDEQIQSRMQY